MPSLTFDTLSATKQLTEAGVPEQQAEAFTLVVKNAQDAHVEQLATKSDIAEVKTEIQLLDAKIDRVADRLLIRLGSMMIAIGGILLAYLELRT